MLNVETITILGANGNMGCLVAGIFASFSNSKVYMISRDIEKSKKAVQKAVQSVKADSISSNLIPSTYDDLKHCLAESDWVFESVSEDLQTKIEINQLIADNIKEDTIISTGTSGLPVVKLSKSFSDKMKKNYLGTHFYNPPYSMILCEVIPTEYTNLELLASIKTYLKNVLYRNVVQVKDTPAFLGNRIGFQSINEALQYAERYKDNGGIDYIDSILGQFTGRSMAPLATTDFVGLDVHKAIVDNIYQNTQDFSHDSFVMPEFAKELIESGRLGRKTCCGLYRMNIRSDGSKTINVYNIDSKEYVPKEKYNFPFAKKMIAFFREGDYQNAFISLIDNCSLEANICLTFLLKYVIYSIFAAIKAGEDIKAADAVMASGFNWAHPLSIIDALGGVGAFKQIALERLEKNYLNKVNLDLLLDSAPASDFDFRRYFNSTLTPGT
jgi:3-hydroxyacyl-CoA dehydrogenase